MKRFFVLFLLIPALVLPVRGETIRWVDFDVSYESMKYALDQDILTAQQEKHISWIDSLALAACRTGGKCGLNAVKQAVSDLKKDKSTEELLGELYAHDAVVEVGGVEAEFAVAVENVGDAGKVAEIVVDTLDGYHRLLVLVYSQRIVLDTLGGNIHIRQLAYAGEQRVVGRSRLALYGYYLQLRVDICK